MHSFCFALFCFVFYCCYYYYLLFIYIIFNAFLSTEDSTEFVPINLGGPIIASIGNITFYSIQNVYQYTVNMLLYNMHKTVTYMEV